MGNLEPNQNLLLKTYDTKRNIVGTLPPRNQTENCSFSVLRGLVTLVAVFLSSSVLVFLLVLLRSLSTIRVRAVPAVR